MLKKRIISTFIAFVVVFAGILPSSSMAVFAETSTTSFINGTMEGWTIINPGLPAYELVKGSGLKLSTQPSGMQQGTNADGDVSNPFNVFTRSIDGTSWEAIAKVYYPNAPVQNYQQMAFGVYEDANNYMKVDVEYNSGYSGRVAQFSINRNGTYTHSHRTALSLNNAALTNNDANRITDLIVYYKIVRSDDLYTAYVSFNGIDYVNVGTGTGTGSSNSNGQYTAEYSAPKLFVAAINDTTYSTPLNAYCEFVKVFDAGESSNVLEVALTDVVNYAKNEANNFNAVNNSMNMVSGNRYDELLFSQFPVIPAGYSYKLVSGDENLLVVNADTGVVSAQRPGSSTLELQIASGSLTHTLKTIDVTITEGSLPVTVTFDYNYSGAPTAPASFVKTTVGGKLESFPVEQTLPQYGSRQNYGFTGWKDSAGNKVTLDTVFTADTTLYAQWEEVPSLYKEYADYFIMGMFADYSYNANPNLGTAQYIYNKHYNIACPSNNFKLTNMIDTSAMRSNFTAARNSILANDSLSEEEKREQIQIANEQVVLRSNPSVNTQLNALRNWNNANPDNPKYTRFHVVAWHGGQQPDAFFGNGFTGGTNLTNRDEPWDSSQDGVVASRETMKARLDNYIRLLMERYKEYADLIVSWDIVNEPVDDYTGQIRNSSNELGDSSQQAGGQWGRVWHDRNPATNPDGSIKYTTEANRMGVVVNQERLYDESEFLRWAFESAAKWTKHYDLNWPLYVNDYMDSNKLYTKLQPTLDITQWVRDNVDLQGVPLAYGFQGRLAYAYPTIEMLRKQADDALEFCDVIGVTEADIRSDFEPNPYFNPLQGTRKFASGMTPAWNSNNPNTAGSGSTSQVGGSIGNTVDAHNSPVRRMPEFGTGNGMTAATVNRVNNFAPDGRSYNIISNGELFAVSEQNMKYQADFAADWMDILIERASRVELYQWDNYSDSQTFNSSKAAHLWVNSGLPSGRSGIFEKYAFFAVLGAPARDKLKTAINAFPPSYWAANQAEYDEAQALLAKRIYTLEGVNDVKELTASLNEKLSSLSSAYITYDTNGGSGTLVTETYSKDAVVTTKTAQAVGFSKSGYTFTGWNTSANGIGTEYEPNASITMNTSVRLYAQWKKSPTSFTVAFDSFTNGTGSSLVDASYPPVEVAAGSVVSKPAVNPKKNGFRFRGWYRDMALTNPWDFDTPVTENMRLYAAYEEVQPARAASISIDGQPIEGFNSRTIEYTLYYEQAQSSAPVVSAIAEESEDEVYTVTYEQATAIPGVAKVTVSGQDAETVYTINFALRTPSLSTIELNNVALAGFDPEKLTYSINCRDIVEVPQITAATAAFQGLTVSIVQADSIPGTATVTVGRDSTDEVVYTIKFTVGPTGDSFVAGNMDDNWTILNEDSDNYSLDKGRGLRLPTLTNDIDGAGKSWNNVFVREVEGNWSVTAKVFFPESPRRGYQQIALLAWADDDNYIKVECEGTSTSSSGGTNKTLQFRRELNGSASNLGSTVSATNFHDSDNSLTLYYRLTKTGSNTYTAHYSRDGVTFSQLGTANSTLDNVTHIGLFAVKNQSGAPTIDTYCEYVEFTSIEGETIYTNEEMRQLAVDNVRDYVAADLPVAFDDDGQITFSQMPRGYAAEITSTGNPDVISASGSVTCPEGSDVIVPITVTITDSSSTAVTASSIFTSTFDLNIRVKGKKASDFNASIDEDGKISVKYVNTGTTQVTGNFIAAVYDNGVLVKVERIELDVAPSATVEKTFNLTVNDYTGSQYTIKTFAWNNNLAALDRAIAIR